MTATLTKPEAPQIQEPRRKPRMSASQAITYCVALLLIGVILAPVVYMILGGFRTNSQITVDPSGLPSSWHLENYMNVLKSGVFWQEVLNSTFAAAATTFFVVAFGVMAAYVLASYEFRGRSVMYAVFAAGLMFPMTVAITPLYLMVRSLGLTNSLVGVVVPQVAFALSVTIIILVPFLRALPPEIEEAAVLDGCRARSPRRAIDRRDGHRTPPAGR